MIYINTVSVGNIMQTFILGEVLYGFCNGFFGRDSYENKRVEAFGIDWVVCRDEDGQVHFATFEGTDKFWSYVKEWRKREQ